MICASSWRQKKKKAAREGKNVPFHHFDWRNNIKAIRHGPKKKEGAPQKKKKATRVNVTDALNKIKVTGSQQVGAAEDEQESGAEITPKDGAKYSQSRHGIDGSITSKKNILLKCFLSFKLNRGSM